MQKFYEEKMLGSPTPTGGEGRSKPAVTSWRYRPSRFKTVVNPSGNFKNLYPTEQKRRFKGCSWGRKIEGQHGHKPLVYERQVGVNRSWGLKEKSEQTKTTKGS